MVGVLQFHQHSVDACHQWGSTTANAMRDNRRKKVSQLRGGLVSPSTGCQCVPGHLGGVQIRCLCRKEALWLGAGDTEFEPALGVILVPATICS